MNDEQRKKLKKTSVLFVDDETLVVDAMRDIFPMLFQTSFFASNGEEALEIYKMNPVDIIITDITMPKMGGLELMQCIKKINPSQKCIFVSGHNEIEIIQQSKQVCSVYILKPINSQLLFQALEEVL